MVGRGCEDEGWRLMKVFCILGVWSHGTVDGGGQAVGAHGHNDVSAGRYWGVFARGGCCVAFRWDEGNG